MNLYIVSKPEGAIVYAANTSGCRIDFETVSGIRIDRMRAAKRWFGGELSTVNYEEFSQKYPRGSEGFTRFLAIYVFFEMVGTFIMSKIYRYTLGHFRRLICVIFLKNNTIGHFD